MSVELAPEVQRRSLSAESITNLCGAALLVYGVFLRVWIYVQNYSLNHDEAALALNLMHRSTAQLMRPLDWLQAAPFGFLLIEHGVMRLAGPGERALRLFPLLCSVTALTLFWWFLRRRIGGWAHIIALGFLIASQDLAVMASRVKQYPTEVLASVVLLFVCDWLLGLQISRRKLWASVLLGALLPWFAFSSVFVVAGIGSACVLAAVRQRELRKRYVPVFAAWAVSVGMLLVAVKQLGGAREGLIRFWSANFVPFDSSIGRWLCSSLLTFGGSVMSVRLAPLAIIALGFGIVMAIRARDGLRGGLVAAIGWCLLASALRQYPFTGRFLFFLVPAALVLIAKGLNEVQPAGVRKAAFAVAAIALAYAGVSAAKNLLVSPKALHEDDPRGVLVKVKGQWQPGDQLYLSSGATPPFLYYQSRLGFDARDFVSGRVASSFTWGPVFTTFPEARRVWFMYLPSLDGPFDEQALERGKKTGHELSFIDGGFYAAKLVEVSNP